MAYTNSYTTLSVKRNITPSGQPSLKSMAYTNTYTECQKKHHFFIFNVRNITSSGQPSLKPKASKCIIFGHRLAIVLLILKLYLKSKVCLSQKGEKCNEITRGHLIKITETVRLPGSEFALTKNSKVVTYPTIEIE